MTKCSLAIGFFDGVHLGHQALLYRLKQEENPTILTFSNHPKEVLSPPAPKQIIPLEEKLLVLKSFTPRVLVTPFTKEFASTPFDRLLDRFDLSFLILGKGAVFGKDREGDEKKVRSYAEKQGFSVEYFPKTFFDGEAISSSRIREAIEKGDKKLVRQLLGRAL